MALTSVGAIYATGSKLLQRVYIPHADDSEIAQQHVGPGETLTTVPLATYQTGGAPAVQVLIGTPTFSGRCAVVSSGTVVDHIIADPVLYPGVVASDVSMTGDTWDGTNFSRPYAEVSFSNGQVISISKKTVPAAPETAGNYLVSHPPRGWAVKQVVLPALKMGVKGT